MANSKDDIKVVSVSDRSFVHNLLNGTTEKHTYEVEHKDGSRSTIRANDLNDLGEIISKGGYKKK